MSYSESFLLGLVQGLGEFLPISSSGHLIVAPWLLGLRDAGLGYSVALHLGTLLAVMIYFFKDLWQLTRGGLSYAFCKNEKNQKAFHEMMYLIIATIPAAVAGILLEDFADDTFRAPWLVGCTMFALGALLWKADNQAQKNLAHPQTFTFKMAFIIGCSQALALLPGVSRSGITITTALFLGLTRQQSARFSFLLSTPIILGACVLKFSEIQSAFVHPEALLGLVTSAVVGFLSIAYLMKWVQNSSYKIFSVYRFIFSGVVLLGYIYSAIR